MFFIWLITYISKDITLVKCESRTFYWLISRTDLLQFYVNFTRYFMNFKYRLDYKFPNSCSWVKTVESIHRGVPLSLLGELCLTGGQLGLRSPGRNAHLPTFFIIVRTSRPVLGAVANIKMHQAWILL